MKRKMLAGLVLLNLCAISLNVTAGEVSISNQEVLDQLVDLRNFIDEKRDFTKQSAKGLKPVAVQYRSSASKFDGIVYCNLSFNTDALHLSIAGYSVQADGTPLSIIINVVYEWTEYVGYTIKSAKINASKGFTNIKVADVKNIDGEILSQLKCGDVVIKEDVSGEHAYIVTYRGETGICLTYTDASVVETQSYDLVGDDWIYNSEDKTDILNPLLESIKDKDGNTRFVENNFSVSKTGVVSPYSKWSLSGTHLMIVCCLEIDANISYSNGEAISNIALPEFIKNKIVPLTPAGGASIVAFDTPIAFSEDYANSSSFDVRLNKTETGVTIYKTKESYSVAYKSYVRFAFDLLIDNE